MNRFDGGGSNLLVAFDVVHNWRTGNSCSNSKWGLLDTIIPVGACGAGERANEWNDQEVLWSSMVIIIPATPSPDLIVTGQSLISNRIGFNH